MEYVNFPDDRLGDRSTTLRLLVEAARATQREPLAETTLTCDADMGPAEVRGFFHFDSGGPSTASLRQAQAWLPSTSLKVVLPGLRPKGPGMHLGGVLGLKA